METVIGREKKKHKKRQSFLPTVGDAEEERHLKAEAEEEEKGGGRIVLKKMVFAVDWYQARERAESYMVTASAPLCLYLSP
jgi:hypothetical protein